MKKLVTLCIACMAYVIAFAQLPCGTDKYQQELWKRFPQLRMAPPGEVYRTTTTDTATYDITVVVHVIHDYGTEYVSDAAIIEAFNEWARVMMLQNTADTATVIPTFKPYVGNAKMRLHLATKDPNGNPTKGITRRQSYLTFQGNDQAKMDQWPQDRYFNIWLVNDLTYGTAYAIFPSYVSTVPYYDGAISMAQVMDYMHTIPHEIGHCMSLHHTWGDIDCGVSCSGTDSVDDTPPTMGHLVTYCAPTALYDTVCAYGYQVHYTDISGNDSVYNYPDTTNAQNIMDYTYCPRMFTKGQTQKMRECLTSPIASRNNLITPATLAATGALAPMPDLPPVADYIMGAGQGATFTDPRCYFLAFTSPARFQFRNTSWNDTVSSVSWTFSNGATTPTSTNMTSVDNRFATPGWVTASITANSNAGTNTLTNTQAVYAADTTPVGGVGYTQSFASAGAIANWPMFNYYNNSFKWEFFSGAGKDDNSCVRFRSFDPTALTFPQRIVGSAKGDIDDLFTPAFDLAGAMGNVYLNFYTTGASTLSGIDSWTPYTHDTLEIFVTKDGGVQWQKIATYDGYELQNNGTINTEFTPTSTTGWIPRTVNVPVAYHTRNTYFRIRFRPGITGNNVYLDNLHISALPSGVQQAFDASAGAFSVFPNPSDNGSTLAFRTGAEQHVRYCIRDVAGKLVYERTMEVAPNTVMQEPVARSVIPSAGIYFVTMTIDGMNQTIKMVVNP